MVGTNSEVVGEIGHLVLEVDIKEEAKSGLGFPEAIRKDYMLPYWIQRKYET